MRVSYFVTECSEFPELGIFHDGIEDVNEAIRLFEEIPSGRMNGVKSIGVAVGDAKCGVLFGRKFDFDTLAPELLQNVDAMRAIVLLLKHYPFYDVNGNYPTALIDAILVEGKNERFVVPYGGIAVS